MLMPFNRKLVAALSAVALVALPAMGADFLIDKDKIEVTPPPDTAAKFTIRLTRAGAVVKADALVGGKETPVTVSPVTGEKTAVYFLLDISDQKNDEFAKVGKETIRQTADNLVPVRDFEVGLGTIGSNFTHWFYAIPEKVARDAAINGAAAGKSERTSEIYRCAMEGMDELKSLKGADRKVMVILSGGKSDDKDPKYTPDELVKEANRDGITIFTIGYARTEAETARWQSLRRIAKETGGLFIETDLMTKLPKQDLVIQLRGILDSAAKIAVDLKDVPPGDQDMTVHLALNDGRGLEVQRKIPVPAAVATPPPATPAASTPSASTPGATAATATPSVHDDKPSTSPKWLWPAVIGGSVVFLGLLAGLIVKMTRSAPPIPPVDTWPDTGPGGNPWPPQTDNGTVGNPDAIFNNDVAPPIEPETQYVLGWLEQIDKTGSRGPRHAIVKSKLNIGRSADSDLRFDDESVSVHHATIHRRSDRTLAITDLHSSNGIYVNSKRVEHSVLKDQDLIEIGEIRLKLSLNQSQS